MRSSVRIHIVMEKLAGFVGWLTNQQWPVTPTEPIDELYTEIYQLEKMLADAPSRPVRRVRSCGPLEPITEQQRITDLAG